MAEYGSMFSVSVLAAILFFGGWNGPIPIFQWLGWAYEQGATSWTVYGYVANLFGLLNVLLKGIVGVTVMMWVRWTLPRLRIDQVMTTCLKYCVPLAAFCFIGVVVWQLMGWPFLNDIAPAYKHGPATVRESWVLADQVAVDDSPQDNEPPAQRPDSPEGAPENAPAAGETTGAGATQRSLETSEVGSAWIAQGGSR
jgi:NADH-quinone oxidoreductase subunit H